MMDLIQIPIPPLRQLVRTPIALLPIQGIARLYRRQGLSSSKTITPATTIVAREATNAYHGHSQRHGISGIPTVTTIDEE